MTLKFREIEVNKCKNLGYACGEYFCNKEEGSDNMYSSWEAVCKSCKNVQIEIKLLRYEG